MDGLDIAAFRATPLTREPFPFLIVPHFVKPAARVTVNADYPIIDSPGSFPVTGLTYGPGFQKLLDACGPEFCARPAKRSSVSI